MFKEHKILKRIPVFNGWIEIKNEKVRITVKVDEIQLIEDPNHGNQHYYSFRKGKSGTETGTVNEDGVKEINVDEYNVPTVIIN